VLYLAEFGVEGSKLGNASWTDTRFYQVAAAKFELGAESEKAGPAMQEQLWAARSAFARSNIFSAELSQLPGLKSEIWAPGNDANWLEVINRFLRPSSGSSWSHRGLHTARH
jgi:hypothetical protein